jgi:hypothetical protein
MACVNARETSMEMMSMASLAGSTFSTVATAYFWLVRARREKPQLRSYLVNREFFYGLQRPPQRHIGLKLGIVVANYSLLPNALLGVELWLRGRGDAWLPLHNPTFDKQTPLPFNVPSMNTVLLCVNGTLALPIDDKLEEGGLPGYLNHHLAEPREIKVQLRGLLGKLYTEVLGLPAQA